MLSTRWVTGPFGSVIGELTGGMAVDRGDTLAEVCMPILRACTMLGADVSVAVWVEVMVELCSETLLHKLKRVLPDVGILVDVDANIWLILMLVLKFMILPSSLEELLLF